MFSEMCVFTSRHLHLRIAAQQCSTPRMSPCSLLPPSRPCAAYGGDRKHPSGTTQGQVRHPFPFVVPCPPCRERSRSPSREGSNHGRTWTSLLAPGSWLLAPGYLLLATCYW